MLILKYNNGTKIIACYCEEPAVIEKLDEINEPKSLSVRYIPNPSLLSILKYNFKEWKSKQSWLILNKK